MVTTLSTLVDNLSERLYRTKCKLGHDDKKCGKCRIKCRSIATVCFLITQISKII